MQQPYRETRVLGTGLTLALVACLSGPAAAQDALDWVEQVSAGSGGSAAPIEQVSTGTREIATPSAEGRSTAPVQQLSSAGEARPAPSQLSEAERDAKPPVQLYQGGPTAQPPQALSHRSEGRTGPIDPVEGEDVCDPADEIAAKAEVCERVIETRSAEFVRPDPTVLSPEQRLIVQQRLREGPTSGPDATRRLARQGDADSLEGLGVASMVLNQPGAPPEDNPDDPLQDPAADAATAAILEIIGQGASVTPPQ